MTFKKWSVLGVMLGILLTLPSESAQTQQQQPKQAKDADLNKALDQKKIDEAIKKGCEYLLQHIDEAITVANPGNKQVNSTHAIRAELVLYTLIHGEAFSEKDAGCKKLLDFVLSGEPQYTYRAALKAMALQALDKSKYVEYIAQCGQFLIDTQREDGAWSYGEPVKFDDVETPGARNPQVRSEKSDQKSDHGKKTGVNEKLSLKRRKLAPGRGTHGVHDNSNTQYAALGLRAVMDSGVEIPKGTIELALKWWETSQFEDGHWEYISAGGGIGGGGTGVAGGGRLPQNPRGGAKMARPYTMTAGGISSVAIYKFYLGKCKKKQDFAKDPQIAAGLKWLALNYKILCGGAYPLDGWGDFYWFYSFERAGILSETPKFAAHDWYKEGANWLLANQADDGGWGKGISDTCFAILFLKRATQSFFETQRGKDVVEQ